MTESAMFNCTLRFKVFIAIVINAKKKIRPTVQFRLVEKLKF